MGVRLIWITPDAENLIAYCARVSNPANQDNPSYEKLINYCIKHKHWSVFEMASACFEIEAPRDISRQILRHRSFHFQEFSQRYADVSSLPPAKLRECREQDLQNRQNSVLTYDAELAKWWNEAQQSVNTMTDYLYKVALDKGIAKEQARALLPEGLTPSRLYMQGTIRDWIHYVEVRSGNGTQKEHAEIAKEIRKELGRLLPTIFGETDDSKDSIT